MAGVIRLGQTGSMRDYSIARQGDGLAWSRGPANPFAAKVDTSTQYDSIDSWNEKVDENWQAGVGRVDPEAGGFLYGEVDSRVPNQLILSPLLQQCDTRDVNGTTSDVRYMAKNIAGSITVGAGGYAKVAMKFTNGASTNTSGMWHFFAYIPQGVSAKISIYTDSSGSPGSLQAENTSTTISSSFPDKLFRWYGGHIGSNLSTTTDYWLLIEPVSALDAIEVAYGTTDYNAVAKSYNGSTWSDITSTYLLYTWSGHWAPSSANTAMSFFRFDGDLYAHTNGYVYKYDDTNDKFDFLDFEANTSGVGGVVFGPKVYFGGSNKHVTLDTSDVLTTVDTAASLFLEYKGYLYRSTENDLYYSTDGSTWTGPFACGGDDVTIRGMAGMGDSLYLATDKALMRFAPGDIVEEVTRFGAQDTRNGVGMVEHQGKIYIPINGRVFVFDPAGVMRDIWVHKDDDLPFAYLGRIISLTRMNNWLVAYVAPNNDESFASLWAWQEEGWHHLATLPQAYDAENAYLYTAFYDRVTSRLWFAGTKSAPYYLKIADYTLNPFNDSTYLYQPFGWIQQDRFYGGQYLLDKVFYSVTVVGDNLSAATPVKIYWQDEDSTEWELLGTADADGEQLKWPKATRPVSKWIKLGALLSTTDADETPRVRALVLKFLPIIADRRRDSLTLRLHDGVEHPNGDMDDYTLAEQLEHIETLIGLQGTQEDFVCLYEDPFGEEYEVVIKDYNMGISRYGHINSANTVLEVDVQLVLEQIDAGA